MPHNVMLSNKKGDEGDLRMLAIFCVGTGRVSVYCLEGGEQLPLYQLFCFSVLLSSSTAPLFMKIFLS